MRWMGLLSLLTILALSLLSSTWARAADRRPVVAVFDVQTKFLKLPRAKRDMLTELLGQELGVGGVYQVMPPGDVKRTLMEQSSESYKACYDEKCQIELGRQLPANKLVTTTIMKIAGRCRVAASLNDLKRQTTDIVAKEKCDCNEAGLVPAIEKVAAKLRAFGGGGQAFVEEDLGEKPTGDWAVSDGQETIVAFSSDPDGAVVLVDGNLACAKTPCSKSVAQGKHVVSMQAPRYLKRQERVLVAPDTSLDWRLKPNFGWLSVRSEPSGLTVSINGEEAGTTPLERKELEPGVYRVLVSSPCHYDKGKKVKLTMGKDERVSVKLKEKQGAVKVSAQDAKGNDIAADVFVDGERLGKTPGTFKASVCARKLEVRHKKHGKATQDLEIRERKVKRLRLVLKGGGGDLEWVFSRPAGLEFTKSEITVAQYQACVKAGKCTKPRDKTDYEYCNWGYSDRARHPINCIDWNQAKAVCEWAGGRLPTEQEWEAEASNKGRREYPWGGEKPSCERAIWSQGGRGCGRDSTWPVCSKPAGNSVSGLCDMAGSVWEWTSSLYSNTGTTRVVRGGSWDFDFIVYLRASYRDGYDPASRYGNIGVRCVRSVAP